MLEFKNTCRGQMRIFLAVFILLCGVVLADPTFYDLLEINKEANEADIKR